MIVFSIMHQLSTEDKLFYTTTYLIIEASKNKALIMMSVCRCLLTLTPYMDPDATLSLEPYSHSNYLCRQDIGCA